jgi:murein peptide amidase A
MKRLLAVAAAMCGLAPATASGLDPGLAPLGANGGPTPTRGLYPDSPVASSAAKRTVIGRSERGRPIRAVRIGDPESSRVALVVGVIHGDERAGFGITRKLKRMAPDIEGAQIWVVDNLNPDGTRARTRRNANGVDLNRNFPHRWRAGAPRSSGYYPGPKAASERETRAAMALIRSIRPDVSVWYHQPWGAVLACRGRPVSAARYAKLAGMSTSCRGRGLPGTAIGWTKAHVEGSAAFVVEIGPGGLSGRGERRHALAAARIAEES